MQPAQLKIFYKGKSKPIPQGKVFEKDGEWIYLADMTPSKWIREGGGYTIADQILQAFKRKKITILYRRKDLKTIYKARRQLFLKKGWKVAWGNHRQWILPLERFEYSDYFDDEPKNLPSMTVDKWMKPDEICSGCWGRNGCMCALKLADMNKYQDSRIRMAKLFTKAVGED